MEMSPLSVVIHRKQQTMHDTYCDGNVPTVSDLSGTERLHHDGAAHTHHTHSSCTLGQVSATSSLVEMTDTSPLHDNGWSHRQC